MELKNYLRKQPPMRKVLLALIPPLLGGIYYFGWRSLAMVVVSCATAYLAEYIFCKRRKEPVTEAAFVTGTIYALILPPTAQWYVVIIGVAFGIVFAKEVFGGFGRNIFNPAMVGRAFVYICFPVTMTAYWAPVAEVSASHWWGALDRWSTVNPAAAALPADADPYAVTDAITGATPLARVKQARLDIKQNRQAAERIDEQIAQAEPGSTPAADAAYLQEERARYAREAQLAEQRLEAVKPSYTRLLLGNLSGTMGVTSALLSLIGGLYLFWTKTANRTLILTVIVTYGLSSQILYMLGVLPVGDGLTVVLGGGFLFGAFFMVTDPISAPKTNQGRIIYAILIGFATMIIRSFSVFNGGLMFALLLGNMYASVIDYFVNQRAAKKKARAPAAGAGAAKGAAA